jgi:hypothetical protein
MELSHFEKDAIEYYISASETHTSASNTIIFCREGLIRFVQSILTGELNFNKDDKEVSDGQALKTISEKEYFGKNVGRDFRPHNQALGNIKNQIGIITSLRNPITHPSPKGKLEDESIESNSKQCLIAFKEILKWYLSSHKKYILTSITNLTSEQKSETAHLFTAKISRAERITERETYYVVLLIDSSQSMVFPYLKDPNNSNENSTDYKNAIGTVQSAMQFAHQKALNALRGSSICREGYLKIYQYTFNHKKKLLNNPEELSPQPIEGFDKVVRINSSNYLPGGMTALYDVIDESLKVIYDNYLKKTMLEEKRIDKVIIGVITDGEDTVLGSDQKNNKIAEIKQYLKMLRGDGDIKKNFLISSVLIGLTGTDFSENKLKEIKKELSFDESVSINQADEQSIRRAFKLFSTNAINV